MGGGGYWNLSYQLNFRPFLSYQLNFRPFLSYQLISTNLSNHFFGRTPIGLEITFGIILERLEQAEVTTVFTFSFSKEIYFR